MMKIAKLINNFIEIYQNDEKFFYNSFKNHLCSIQLTKQRLLITRRNKSRPAGKS